MNQSRIDIILIRHGETKNNTEGRFCGRTDYLLTEEGKAFIRDMVAKYPYEVPEKIYCSPATRCIETANISFPGREMEIIEDLQEVFFGDFEEGLASDIFDKPEIYEPWTHQELDFAWPGGERLGDVQIRGARVFREVIAKAAAEGTKRIAIVTHSVLIGLVLRALLKEVPTDPKALYTPNGMGMAIYVEAGESEDERPLRYEGHLPVGAPIPDMSNNPYMKPAKK